MGRIEKLWETFISAEIAFSCFRFALLSSFPNFWMDQFFWGGKTVPLLSKTFKQCSKRKMTMVVMMTTAVHIWLCRGEPQKIYNMWDSWDPFPLDFTVIFGTFLDRLNYDMYSTLWTPPYVSLLISHADFFIWLCVLLCAHVMHCNLGSHFFYHPIFVLVTFAPSAIMRCVFYLNFNRSSTLVGEILTIFWSGTFIGLLVSRLSNNFHKDMKKLP